MSSWSALRSVAGWLQGTHERSARVARGARAGIAVEVRFVLRGTGYERTARDRRWTEIDVQLPRGYALSLLVRRHEWMDEHQIERAAMVDLQLGDAEFDRQFLVEAAPAEVARTLLDGAVRSLLASHDAAALATEMVGDRPVLRLSVPTWVEVEVITAAIEVLVVLSAGLRDAYAAIDARALNHGGGSPYRPALDDAQVTSQRDTLAEEVAFVAGLRERRE